MFFLQKHLSLFNDSIRRIIAGLDLILYISQQKHYGVAGDGGGGKRIKDGTIDKQTGMGDGFILLKAMVRK